MNRNGLNRLTGCVFFLCLIFAVSVPSVYAIEDVSDSKSDVLFAEDLIKELSAATPLPRQIPESSIPFSLLEPIGQLESSQLTLIMFFGLILIFTIRTFFYMHAKKKQAERDTYAYDLRHSRPHRGRTSTGLHHQKRRKTVSIPIASMSFETLHCNMMYSHRPRRSRQQRVSRSSLSAKKVAG